MPVTMMCGKDTPGAVWVDHPEVEGGIWVRTTHEGLVLREYEVNGYHDSDFYAEVWNPELKRPESVEYASTRGWCGPNRATVDATPETLAAYAEWRELMRVARENAAKKKAAEAAAKAEKKAARAAEKLERAMALKGRMARVKKGPGEGRMGRVVWVGTSRFSAAVRVGLAETGERATVWTGADKVEVVGA